MTTEQRLYELEKKIDWLIDGYFTNCILKSTEGKFCISTEWIVQCYNVEIIYFRPHLIRK